MGKSAMCLLKCLNTINLYTTMKLLSLFGYVTFIIMLTILLNEPAATSYSFSLYNEYPYYFWVMAIVAIVIGQITILGHLYFDTAKKDWLNGFILIILVNTVLLSIPLTRYFTFGRADVLTHVGYMVDIQNTFSFGINHYPADHLLGTILNYYTDLGFNKVVMIVPPIFSIFSIFSLYLLGKQIFNDKRKILVMLPFSSILPFGLANVLFTPFNQSTLLIPFVLYLFVKSNSADQNEKFRLLLIMLCILIVFFHPLTALVLSLILLIMEITSIYYNNKLGTCIKIKAKNLILIILIIFSIWSSYLRMVVDNLNPLISSILYSDGQSSQFSSYVETISYAEVSFSQLIKLFTYTYGNKVILTILSVFCVLLLIQAHINRNKAINYYHVFSAIGFTIICFMSLMILLFQDTFGFMRIYLYTCFFSYILIPFSLVNILGNKRNILTNIRINQITVLLLCISLILFSTISVFNLYDSPLIKKTNQQVTKAEFNGMNTFFEIRNDSYPILEYGISNFRFYTGIYGFEYPRKNIRLRDTQPTEHFNYTHSSSFSSSYEKIHYFLLSNTRGKYFYPSIYPEFEDKWKFNSSDFGKLSSDTTLYEIYSNKEVSIFMTTI